MHIDPSSRNMYVLDGNVITGWVTGELFRYDDDHVTLVVHEYALPPLDQ